MALPQTPHERCITEFEAKAREHHQTKLVSNPADKQKHNKLLQKQLNHLQAQRRDIDAMASVQYQLAVYQAGSRFFLRGKQSRKKMLV